MVVNKKGGLIMRKEFTGVTMNHALNVFDSVEITDKKMFKRILDIQTHPEWEVCCTNTSTYIGTMGISCTGNVIAAYAEDVSSVVYGEHRITDRKIKECSLEQWRRAVAPEAFVTEVRIKSIWIEDYHAFKIMRNNTLKNFIRLGYPIEITSGRLENIVGKDKIISALIEIDDYIKNCK